MFSIVTFICNLCQFTQDNIILLIFITLNEFVTSVFIGAAEVSIAEDLI